jgi:chromosome segregation ATPase
LTTNEKFDYIIKTIFHRKKLTMNNTKYKSPPHKLINFFKKSRDSWENTAKKRRDLIRDQQARIRDLEKSREFWKHKAKGALDEVEVKTEEIQQIKNVLANIEASYQSLQKEYEENKKKSFHSSST